MILALLHAPLFWLGLGLASVPILIHLFFRRRHRVVRWAAMEFLLLALRKQKRRLQAENLLLLLLRCLAILLFGLAVARPIAGAAALAPLAGAARDVFVLLDTSASMNARHTNLRVLERAKERAEEVVGELPESARVTVIVTCDDVAGAPRAVLESASPSDARQRIASLRAGWTGNRLGELFRLVREKLETARGRAQLLLFTDLQRRDWLDEAGGRREDVDYALRSLRVGEEEPPALTLYDIAPPSSSNVAVAAFSKEEARELFAGTLAGLSARVVNYSDSRASGTLSLLLAREDGSWERMSASPIELAPSLEVGPPSSEIVTLYVPLAAGETGTARFKAVFETADASADRLEEDDTRFLAARVRPPVRFLPVLTVRNALDILRDVEGLDVIEFADPILPEELARADLSRADVILWGDAEVLNLDDAAVRRVEEFVRGGGGFLAYLGIYAQPGKVNELFYREKGAGLLPMLLVDGPPVTLEGDSAPARFDLKEPIDHPLFREMTSSPQARALFQSPDILYFRPVRDIFREASVVARFDTPNHDPAILEHALVNGRILAILTTPDERGFRLNGSLLPAVLFFEAAHYLVSEPSELRNVASGSPLRVPLPPHARQVVLEPPEEAGGRTEWPVEDPGKPFLLSAAVVPGFYRFLVRSTPPGQEPREEDQYAACNLDAAEGDLRRIAPEALLRVYPRTPIRFENERGETIAQAAPAAEGEWSRLLLLVVALLLVGEILLAWSFGTRRRRAP